MVLIQKDMKTNGIEDPDMNPCCYAYLIFDKGAQNIQWKKGNLFNKCCWENYMPACRKLKNRSMSFTLYKYQLNIRT
jgi:hypothetical protein